jgi:HK97 family phage prohead protease
LAEKTIETRSVAEFRAEDDGAFISGHAANFLSVDSKGSAFGRTAFKKTINERGDKVKVFYNHDYARLIGKTTELRNDAKGLKFRAAIVESIPDGQMVMGLVRANVLDGMSFGFRSVKERPGTIDDKIVGLPDGAHPGEVRFITEANLLEISPTPRPSNENPRITDFRSDDFEDALAEILESIRNADLKPEDLERLTEELRSLADTTDQTQPPSTEDDEIRRHNEDLDVDLLFIELGITA